MVSETDLKFTFCSKIFRNIFAVGALQGTRLHICEHEQLFEVYESEVHDSVCNHVIKCTEKRVPRFQILEGLMEEFH